MHGEIYVLAWLAALVALGRTEEITITSPVNDSIVTESTARIIGTTTGGANSGGNVQVRIGQNTATALIANGKWEVPSIAIPNGLGIVEASFQGAIAKIAITRGRGLAAKPRQKVRFLWNTGVEGVLREIATGTLDATLTETQLATFADAVKSRAISAFLVAYQGINIEFVDPDGPDVHTISVLTNSGQIYGQSPLDFSNNTPKQTSEIWLGTYRDLMIGDHIQDWAPMQRSDSLAMRIIDIGEAMGRTCAHEFGHSLGLVGSGPAATGGWMLGCD